MQQMESISPEMQKCIDECMNCYKMCEETATYLMNRDGSFDAKMVQAMMDCSDMVQLCANMMMRRSGMSMEMCTMCAEACRRCIEACKSMSNDMQVQACMEACRMCMETCQQMSAMMRK